MPKIQPTQKRTLLTLILGTAILALAALMQSTAVWALVLFAGVWTVFKTNQQTTSLDHPEAMEALKNCAHENNLLALNSSVEQAISTTPEAEASAKRISLATKQTRRMLDHRLDEGEADTAVIIELSELLAHSNQLLAEHEKRSNSKQLLQAIDRIEEITRIAS